MAVGEVALYEGGDDGDNNADILLPGEQDPAAVVNPPKYISELPSARQFDVIKSIIVGDLDHHRPWRVLVNEWMGFRAGEQWTDDDKAMLRDQRRPVIVFNRVLAFLKAVAGMEINGRHDTFFYPRETEDTAPNEILNAANSWMADSCDAEDEQSQAFDHCATCGIGVTEERMSYEEDVAGLYVEEAIDPREMVWDRTAKKRGLADKRRVARIRSMALSDAMQIFPGFSREQLHASWADDPLTALPLKTLEERRKRDSDNTPSDLFDDRSEVTIVHVQWIEKHCYYLLADPLTNKTAMVPEKQFEVLKERLAALRMPLHESQYVKILRKEYKQAFLGNTMLRDAEAAPLVDRFSWNFITGEYDAINCSWFGLVKVLRDPQMWANKWLSQILHILNTTAKGGILAELDAFDDQREAEEGYARPDSITWMANGALSGKKPKVMPKPGPGLTDGYVNLLQFAIQSFRDVSGMNLELLGQQDINQPGVLEAMRKQAGMTILATLFDALRKYRKDVGYCRLFFIQNYLSDGRLIRVAGNLLGSETARVVRLVKEKTFGKYDVVVDDAPTSPNQKEATWLVLQPLIAVFKDQLMAQPEVLSILLEYSPLPSRIVAEIKKVLLASQNDPEAQQQQKAQMELMVRGALARIMKDESAARLNDAKVMGEEASGTYQMAMARNVLEDNQFAQVRALLDAMEAQNKAQTAGANASAATAKAQREMLGMRLDMEDAQQRRLDSEANRISTVASARREQAGRVIDELTGVAKAQRDRAGAMKDMADARLKERTPGKQPATAGAK